MTDDSYGRGLLAIGGRSMHKRKQSTQTALDVGMDQPISAAFFWRRKKQTATADKDNDKRRKSSGTAGAHELFLEHEGFLPTEEPPRPVLVKPTGIGTHRGHAAKLSEDSGRASSASHSRPRQSFSGFSGTTAHSVSSLLTSSKRRKKSILSFSHSIDQDSPDNIRYERQRQSHDMQRQQRQDVRAPSFLRRCMSIRSQSRPQTPSTPLPAYNESPPASAHLPAPVPEFGLVPGFGYEAPRAPADLSSGAAARAAAAAQNEILATMRSLSLAEPKINRDSESGVGIEVNQRSRTEESADPEVPVVRQDPVHLLPPELMAHVLSFLDAESLVQAELISHDWCRIASSRHAWKPVYRSEFDEAGHGGLPIPETIVAGKDWKNMWKTRRALEQRWIDGYAAAIYLEGHTDSVYCVQFDKEKIVTGSRDRTVRIWDAKTYECVKVLGVSAQNRTAGAPPLPMDVPEFGTRPFAKVFSPHTIGSSNSARTPFVHTGSILCLQYDDEIMVTGSSDWSLIIWDVKAGYQTVRKLKGHTQGVLDVCFDNKYIVSCSKDTSVKLWDRTTGQLLRTLSGHRGPVNAVQLRGNLVVSASGDGIAKLWNLTSGLCIKEFPSKDRGMACVEFSPDSRTILAGGNDQVIYQFDTNSGELVGELKGHEGLVRSLHLDSSSGRVVSGSYDTSVKAFDLKTGRPVVTFTKWTSSWILSAKADYRRIIATSQDSRAVIMDFGYQLPGVEALEV